MEKLTIEHLAPYLSCGLKGTDGYSYYILSLMSLHNPNDYYEKRNISYFLDYQIKPLLYPLSMLTKEIELDGIKFVPVEWIEENSSIGYDPIKELVNPLAENVQWINHCEYYIVQYLLQWHFDVFGLIEKELAIDKTTI